MADASRAALDPAIKASLAALPESARQVSRLMWTWINCVSAHGGAVTKSTDGMIGVTEVAASRQACADEQAAITAYTETAEYKTILAATRAESPIGWQCVADAGYDIEGVASRSANPLRSVPADTADANYADVISRCGVHRMGEFG